LLRYPYSLHQQKQERHLPCRQESPPPWPITHRRVHPVVRPMKRFIGCGPGALRRSSVSLSLRPAACPSTLNVLKDHLMRSCPHYQPLTLVTLEDGKLSGENGKNRSGSTLRISCGPRRRADAWRN
jgi:hypothetical protein